MLHKSEHNDTGNEALKLVWFYQASSVERVSRMS